MNKFIFYKIRVLSADLKERLFIAPVSSQMHPDKFNVPSERGKSSTSEREGSLNNVNVPAHIAGLSHSGVSHAGGSSSTYLKNKYFGSERFCRKSAENECKWPKY